LPSIEVLDVPFEFALFALTLLGVALFHHRTLEVAAGGLVLIVLYKFLATGFDGVPGLGGFIAHLGHEWVILANLLGLLTGFALLSRHFEASGVPEALPALLPNDWRGGFVLLALIFVLSAFLDNIAAALIGGTVAAGVFRRRVHIGYLAAIVAASNAGGSGSVVGDTTTTMMWIDGVAPGAVLHAYVAAAVALFVFGIPAAMLQQRHQPIAVDSLREAPLDHARLVIVAAILAAAIAANVTINLRFPELAERVPALGLAVWVVLLATAGWRRPDWAVLPATLKGSLFLLCLVTAASLMPVERLPVASW
jgi:Na+/H+ antiporter NhaD/arsenite permease-like protein